MNRRLVLGLLAAAALFPCALIAQGRPHRVVFAMTSANQQDWTLALGNIANLKKGFAPAEVEVEVVAYGPGVAMVEKDSTIVADLDAAMKTGVKIVACQNSMRRMQLTKADLVTGIDTVASGIVEVVKKQEDGWVYIKGGQ